MVPDWSVNEYKFTQLSFLIDIFLYIKKIFFSNKVLITTINYNSFCFRM